MSTDDESVRAQELAKSMDTLQLALALFLAAFAFILGITIILTPLWNGGANPMERDLVVGIFGEYNILLYRLLIVSIYSFGIIVGVLISLGIKRLILHRKGTHTTLDSILHWDKEITDPVTFSLFTYLIIYFYFLSLPTIFGGLTTAFISGYPAGALLYAVYGTRKILKTGTEFIRKQQSSP